MAKNLSHYLKTLQWMFEHYRAEHDVEIETANGLLSVSNKDWLIGKHLFVRREYEIEFIRDAIKFLKSENLLPKTETVCDIGANLGMISVALLNEKFFENALAFEPAPRNFRLLRKNAELNGFSENLKCFQVALSSENGESEFEIAEDNSGDSRIRKTSAKGEMNEHFRRTVSVEAKTFDSFLAENQINSNKIDLLWIDIQGHEGHFFAGANGFFKARKIPVVNEFWGYGINRSGMSREEYCKIVTETFSRFYLLTDEGFRLQSISEIENLFEKYNKPRQIANIILV